MYDRKTLLEKVSSLTDNDKKYLRGKCNFETRQEIADRMSVNVETVDTTLSRIYGKLGVSIKEIGRAQHNKHMITICDCLKEYDNNHPLELVELGSSPTKNEQIPQTPKANTESKITKPDTTTQDSIDTPNVIDPSPQTYTFLQKTLINLKKFPQNLVILIAGLSGLSGLTYFLNVSPQNPCITFDPSLAEINRSQGFTNFTPNNGKGLLSPKIRTLFNAKDALYIGYFSINSFTGGISSYDKTEWKDCTPLELKQQPNINAITQDSKNNIWIASEKNGIWKYDQSTWTHYQKPNLPTNETFGISADKNNNIYVATYEGIAKFDGKTWSNPYNTSNNTLINNRTHAVLQDAEDNLWIGYISHGVSILSKSQNKWLHYNATSGLTGNNVRKLRTRYPTSPNNNEVWIATDDGGISIYKNGAFKNLNTGNGLPNNSIQDIDFDKHDRPWIATDKGVFYFMNNTWIQYHNLPAYAIALGCQGCKYDDDHVLTGLQTQGLTHSRLPYNESPIDLIDIKYFRPNGTEITTPIFRSGEKIRIEISMRPRIGYSLNQDRGDALWSLEPTEKRYGAYVQIAVIGTVSPGLTYKFTDFDNYITIPELPPNTTTQTITMKWRVWMYTRFAGNEIPVQFTITK